MNPKCTLCGGITKKLSHPKIGNFYWCKHCEYIYKDPKDYISEDFEFSIYQKHNNSIDDPRYSAYFKKFIDGAIVEYASIGQEGLDFGSGPSPVLARILEAGYGYNMEIYDKFYAPEPIYRGKKYDLITCTEVIEHIQDPLEYLHLFHDLLKSDGLLAIMTLFHSNNLEEFIGWHYMRDRSHVSFFTKKTFEFMANKAGFEIVYCDDIRYITLKLKK